MNKEIKLNQSVSIDLPKLVDSRLLVQANSGGGKSWLLRRLLEQSHGKVQQIVIDLEGEFSTLREKYDYILAGKGGDTPAEPRSAAVLARKILELNVSAIVDLYELHHHERKRFVKLFLDAMVNAPKELWHPCLVIVDEAHIFCPEKGQAESADAVIDIATRGRKRGYCVVLATQRLSKLHKDAAAECNNKLIGRTGLDIDMKRASEELGFTSKEQYLSLRNLDAGEFFIFGPALSQEVVKTKIGEVKTTHPKAGARISAKVVPPTDRMRSVLKKLSDLPEEARKEAQTVKEMKEEIMILRRHRCPKVNSKEDIEQAVNVALAKRDKEWTKAIEKERVGWKTQVDQFAKLMQEVNILISQDPVYPKPATPEKLAGLNISYSKIITNPNPVSSKLVEKTYPTNDPDSEKSLTGGALRMLKVLVSRYPMLLTRAQLATFSRLSPRSGTFGTYLSFLRSRELIVVNGNYFQASESGIHEIGEAPNPPQTSEEVIELWRNILKGGARKMFDVLISGYPGSLTREELGEQTELSSGSGTFGTYLSMLRSNGLIETNGGNIKASENLFL